MNPQDLREVKEVKEAVTGNNGYAFLCRSLSREWIYLKTTP
jgi:hypothetical protein